MNLMRTLSFLLINFIEMSFLEAENSEYLESQLDISSKIEQKEESQAEEIADLSDKINKMEKNYILMEKFYWDKLKNLHKQLIDKDHEFKRLQSQLVEMKHLSLQHKKKVQQIAQTSAKVDQKVKSRSPLIRKSTEKAEITSARNSANNSESDTQRKQFTKKSQSPKNDAKKISPKHRSPYQKPMFNKIQMGVDKYQAVQKNSSSERLGPKSISPKNSYEHRKSGSMKGLDASSLKIQKKNPNGLGSLKEKAPIFK